MFNVVSITNGLLLEFTLHSSEILAFENLLHLKRFQSWCERVSELHLVKELIFLCKILNKTNFYRQAFMWYMNLKSNSILLSLSSFMRRVYYIKAVRDEQ